MYNNLLLKNITNFEDKIKAYAKLILKEGLGFQKNWGLIISCPTIAPELARACSQEAYKLGAKNVEVIWTDPYIEKDNYVNNDIEILENIADWPQEAKNKYKNDVAIIIIHSEDCNLLADLNNKRTEILTKNNSKIFTSFKHGLEIPYTICAAASTDWAKNVFPELSLEDAYVELWKKVFEAVGITDKSDGIKRWQKKKEDEKLLEQKLENLNFQHLHITTEIGTDLKIELPKNHIWFASPVNYTADGRLFSANIPTEEIFSVPTKLGTNGKIVASRPICLPSGEGTIYGASFEFKNGKVINYDAEKGKENLTNIFNIDENSKYLGEIAIVPHNTPISLSELTYFLLLFDENAGCHIALGNAYAKCLKDGTKMSKQELESKGLNVAETHTDIVFGTPKTKIVGYTQSGEEILTFKNGKFQI